MGDSQSQGRQVPAKPAGVCRCSSDPHSRSWSGSSAHNHHHLHFRVTDWCLPSQGEMSLQAPWRKLKTTNTQQMRFAYIDLVLWSFTRTQGQCSSVEREWAALETTDLGWVLTALVTGCVALGKFCNFSEPHFAHLLNAGDDPYLCDHCESKWGNIFQCPAQWLAHSRHIVNFSFPPFPPSWCISGKQAL